MKKLLLLLLCVPLITLFNSCSSGGTISSPANFLESKDGSVWILQENNYTPNENNTMDSYSPFGSEVLSKIGFYNSDYFLCLKSVDTNGNCRFLGRQRIDTLNGYSDPTWVEQSVILDSPSELIYQNNWFYTVTDSSVADQLSIPINSTYEYISSTFTFTQNSPNSNQMNLEIQNNFHGSYDDLGWIIPETITKTFNLLYIKSSTETNLSCN